MAREILTPLQFDLAIAHADVDGIAMGVLGDGTPYLTSSGLARAAGQSSSAIRRITEEWSVGCNQPGWPRITELASDYGHRETILYRDVTIRGESDRVYPDAVCMAILEYFAFEAGAQNANVAQQSFRLLARQSLRHFIYTRVGYDPYDAQSDSWQYLHDRVALNPLPVDYFSVFGEITDLLITAIQAGLVIGPQTIPDISVGLRWGRYWNTAELEDRYGPRARYPHRYPTAISRLPRLTKPAEIQAWVYPIAALSEFRTWMRDAYLPTQFPVYLSGKARGGSFSPARIENLVAAVNDNQLPGSPVSHPEIA